MNARILNRSAEPPKDGWFQIEVTGEWPAGTFPDGRPRRQVIDRAALDAIVNRFNQDKTAAGDAWTGLLVDKDHLSHDLENSTEAMAWLQDVAIRNDERGEPQLWGRLDLSDIGEDAVKNRRYKRFSTEYPEDALEDLGDGRVRPLRLTGLAFTNRPNNRGGKPISNRVPGTLPTPGETKPNTETNNTMKSIAEKLGLSAEATEADILSAITKLQSELAETKTKEATTAAETVMNRFGNRVPEASRPHWKAELIRNREATEKLMETSFPEKATETTTRIFNRGDSQTPAPVGDGGSAGTKAEQQAAAVHAIRNRDKCSHTQAFDQARRENPALFN